MKSRDFCYWLQGFFEIQEQKDGPPLTSKQVNMIKAHLAMVFKHEIDPSMGDENHQEDLQDIHDAIEGNTDNNIFTGYRPKPGKGGKTNPPHQGSSGYVPPPKMRC